MLSDTTIPHQDSLTDVSFTRAVDSLIVGHQSLSAFNSDRQQKRDAIAALSHSAWMGLRQLHLETHYHYAWFLGVSSLVRLMGGLRLFPAREADQELLRALLASMVAKIVPAIHGEAPSGGCAQTHQTIARCLMVSPDNGSADSKVEEASLSSRMGRQSLM